MINKWTEAGGEHQVPFMLAARRVFEEESILCPKCGAAALRYYFHAFDSRKERGTLWVWCPHCFTRCQLSRVSPANVRQNDPFAALTLDAFAELETDSQERFSDRLNRLWEEGALK